MFNIAIFINRSGFEKFNKFIEYLKNHSISFIELKYKNSGKLCGLTN